MSRDSVADARVYAFGVVCAWLLVLAAPAAATTVTRTDLGPVDDLLVQAGAGQVNDISIAFTPSAVGDPNPGTYSIVDQGSAMSTSPSCTLVAQHEVSCPSRNPATGHDLNHDITVDAGDLADSVVVHSTGRAIGFAVLGGAGDDTLVGEAAAADLPSLSGGEGNDRLDGAFPEDAGPGDDVLASGPGSQLLNGGEGKDLLTYVARTTPLTIDMRGGPVCCVCDPWPQGEDMIMGMEAATGGSGDDRFIGGGLDNPLAGGPGTTSSTAPEATMPSVAAAATTGS